MALVTNTRNTLTAAALAEAMPSCTFSSVVYRKVGKTQGRGAEKKVVGNDLVKQVFLLGFRYDNLCQRSMDLLATIDPDALLAEWGGTVGGHSIDRATLDAALAEVRESLTLSRDGENTSTTDDVFESFMVDGEPVRGARVYVGGAASPVGTLYIQGLLISSTVLEKGGIPKPHVYREARTAAKDAIRRLLPVGRYVSYRLTPEQAYILKVGGQAVTDCTEPLTVDAALIG
jgi:hypothetical protein